MTDITDRCKTPTNVTKEASQFFDIYKTIYLHYNPLTFLSQSFYLFCLCIHQLDVSFVPLQMPLNND
jgi:hypothetical protein